MAQPIKLTEFARNRATLLCSAYSIGYGFYIEMKWSLREILRRDCVARFASHCPETSEVVHPRLFFNNRTESLPVKQFRWLSVRDVILTVVVTATFVTFSNNVFGQDGLIPLRLLTDSESSSAQPTSLAAEFADRLEKNQIKAEHEKSKS